MLLTYGILGTVSQDKIVGRLYSLWRSQKRRCTHNTTGKTRFRPGYVSLQFFNDLSLRPEDIRYIDRLLKLPHLPIVSPIDPLQLIRPVPLVYQNSEYQYSLFMPFF